MQLKHLLCLGLSAALASAYEVKWCNEKKLGEPCITEAVKFNECTAIPDSNAKGDAGSSYEFTDYKNNRLVCWIFYELEYCERLVADDKLGIPNVFDGVNEIPKTTGPKGETIVRSYYCLEPKQAKE